MLTVISPAKTLDYDTPPVTERFTLPQYLDHSQDPDRATARTVAGADQRTDAPVRQARWPERRTLSAAGPRLHPGQCQAGAAGLQGRRVHGPRRREPWRRRLQLRPGPPAHALGPVWPAAPARPDEPYRLEMGTKLANARGKDLYAFWGTRISEWLNQALGRSRR